MQRKLLLILGLAAMATTSLAHAASQEEDDARRRAQADAARKKAEKAKQWSTPQARLPSVKNMGPCPFVKVLYDAARYQEFQGGAESTANVGFTGEINNVEAKCQYVGDDPISVQIALQFALGKGPKAVGDTKDYSYFVAVTDRNNEVLAKQSFTVRGEFPAGQDRVRMADTIEGIVIPRAKETVSGSNFEILVGFDVTPQMAEFNRLGKRFRANAVAQGPAPAAAPAQ